MVIPGVSHLFVDTNILVLATDASSPFQAAAETELEEWRKQGTSVVSQKQLELFSLIFSHSGTGATGLDPLQRLFAPV